MTPPDQTPERYCIACNCMRAVDGKGRCIACKALAARKVFRDHDLTGVSYRQRSAEEELAAVEKEQRARLAELEAGRNPWAKPEKTIEELLAEGNG